MSHVVGVGEHLSEGAFHLVKEVRKDTKNALVAPGLLCVLEEISSTFLVYIGRRGEERRGEERERENEKIYLPQRHAGHHRLKGGQEALQAPRE